MIENVLVCLFTAVVLAVSLVLVFHSDYEDGLVGRLGLALIAFAAYSGFMRILDREFQAYVSPVWLLLWAGLALFLLRHLWRFLRWHRTGEGDWRGTDARATAGKQRCAPSAGP